MYIRCIGYFVSLYSMSHYIILLCDVIVLVAISDLFFTTLPFLSEMSYHAYRFTLLLQVLLNERERERERERGKRRET